MNLQLSPGELFPIVRQLNDPTDTATYFIQAVIKRSIDDVTLATVNLTSQGGQRFKTNWQVVSDNGLGVFITITSTVYTDSGYTLKADNYAIEDREYLIQERVNRSFGGSGINYDSIRKMIREEVKKIEFPEIPLSQKFDQSVILSELRALNQVIGGLHIPEPKEVDLGAVLSELGRIQKAVAGIPQPEKPEKVDFSETHKAISKIKDDILFILETNQMELIEQLKKGIPISIALNGISKDKSSSKFLYKGKFHDI